MSNPFDDENGTSFVLIDDGAQHSLCMDTPPKSPLEEKSKLAEVS